MHILYFPRHSSVRGDCHIERHFNLPDLFTLLSEDRQLGGGRCFYFFLKKKSRSLRTLTHETTSFPDPGHIWRGVWAQDSVPQNRLKPLHIPVTVTLSDRFLLLLISFTPGRCTQWKHADWERHRSRLENDWNPSFPASPLCARNTKTYAPPLFPAIFLK